MFVFICRTVLGNTCMYECHAYLTDCLVAQKHLITMYGYVCLSPPSTVPYIRYI